MFKAFNPNPKSKHTGDCIVRAIVAAEGESWDTVFLKLCVKAYQVGDMPSSNDVWGQYLIDRGYRLERLMNTCPYCYTVKDFCKDHPEGTYVLGTGTHAVCVKDGDYYDAWDSGDKVPLYAFVKARSDFQESWKSEMQES